MASDRRQKPKPQLKRRALIGSAKILNAERIWAPKYEAWQNEAWDFYDACGEYRQGVTWFANSISRVRLVAAVESPTGDEPELVKEGPVADVVARLGGSVAGRSRLMNSAATQLTVPGVGWYVVANFDDPELGDFEPSFVDELQWRFFSASEIRQIATAKEGEPQYEVTIDGNEWKKLPASVHVVRVWRMHERFHWLPDSPSRAAMPIVRQVELLNRRIDAVALSRLAGNGVVAITQDITFPTKPENVGAPDPFLAEFVDAALTAIKDPGAPSSVIPLPIHVPGDPSKAMHHYKFYSEYDEQLPDLRDAALRRLAITMDVPAEILLGMGDVNHWTAWQIEESALIVHIDPVVELICHAFTIAYLHPMLRGLDVENWEDYIVWYDDSELATRVDKSEVAITLRDMNIIGDEATRRETGFSEEDKPDPEAERRALIIDLVKGAPSLAPQLLPLIGIELAPVPAPVSSGDPAETPTSADPTQEPTSPPAPALDEGPRSEPSTQGEPPSRDRMTIIEKAS